jgi:hypothetical protein
MDVFSTKLPVVLRAARIRFSRDSNVRLLREAPYAPINGTR